MSSLSLSLSLPDFNLIKSYEIGEKRVNPPGVAKF